MGKQTAYIQELLREALVSSLHTKIKENLETIPTIEKMRYLEGYQEGLDTFHRILLAEIHLGNIKLVVKN